MVVQDKRQYEVLGMPGLISALINKNRKLRHDSHPSNKKVAGGLPPALGGSLFSHQIVYIMPRAIQQLFETTHLTDKKRPAKRLTS